MAVYSMTGFASAATGAADAQDAPAAEAAGARGAPALQIEMRSVNGRFLDLAFRLPDELRALEPALRELLTLGLKRGKVEVRVALRDGAAAEPGAPRPDQLMRLAQWDAQVRTWLPQARPLSVHEVLGWCRSAPADVPGEATVLAAAREALHSLQAARAREGARLADVLRALIKRLRELAAQAQPLVPQAVQRQQQRFLERWQEALAAAGAAQQVPAEALQERALNEAAAQAIRIDVAEELARLAAHLDEIDALLTKGGELGKRLDFLVQELHREANTLGSKSAALELSAIAVEMKVAVEQMREQVQNLE